MASGTTGQLTAAELSARRLRRRLIIGAVLAVSLILIVLNANARGTVPAGTTVEGVSIGGLSAEQAASVLTKKLAPRIKKDITLTADSREVTVDAQKAGLALDVAATVSKATSLTGTGNVFSRLFGKGGAIEPVFTVNQSALDRAIAKISKKLNQAAVDGGLKFSGDTVEAIEPEVGKGVSAESVTAGLLDTALSKKRKQELSFQEITPALSSQQVQDALNSLGKTVVSGPISLQVFVPGTDESAAINKTVTLPIRRLSPFLSTAVVDKKIQIAVNANALIKNLQKDLAGLQEPARDATFRISKGKPVILPSRDGQQVNAQVLGGAVARALSSNLDRVADVGLTTQLAAFTTEDAKKLGVVEKISTFTQPFPYAPYRYQNIGQAAKRVNQTLLKPGDVFSLNSIAKERTTANGYTTGFVIKSGRLQEDLGGGVSTMATATWNAAFFAGLERIEQRAHSFFIARYQPGLEATVAWGTLDLKFRNDSPNGVFITAVGGRNFVRVTMWGTKRYDIEAETGPRTNAKPYSTVTDTSATCTPQDGVGGFKIVVTRVFKLNGKEVKREPLTTTYNPAADITCKKPTPTPTPNPTTTAKPTIKPTPEPTG